MPRHIVTLIVLLVGLVVAGLLAQHFFTVKSFYEFGHFRGDSVPQMAAQDPVLQTSKYCSKCHDDEFGAWSSGSMKTVQCEVCHQAGAGHPKQKRMVIPVNTVRLCTQCHEKMPNRPDTIKQIDLAQHYSGQFCISCHDPHSPKPAVPPEKVVGDVAAGKQAAAACAGCHGENGVSADAAIPNLAGQNAAYLAKALAGHPPVAKPGGSPAPIAKPNEKSVGDLSVYFASLDCSASAPAAQHKLAGDAAAGKDRATLCVACHGDGGRGSNPSWPRLAGQNAGYLADQLNAIKAGTRARKVSVMSDVAGGLSDADIANLAAYFSTSRCRL
jgi:cytochrome c553